MPLTAATPKYSLILRSYPHDAIAPEVCELIYQSRDAKLVGSMTSLPYVVGRSFSASDVDQLRSALIDYKVGFTFKSAHPGHGDIEFDPHQTPTQSPRDLPLKRIRGWQFAKKALLALGMTIIATGAYIVMVNRQTTLPLPDFKDSTPEGRATISRIVQRVELRKDRDLLWNTATERHALHDRDALRTFEGSFATLQYREGSQVIVKPNSLVVIGEISNPQNRSIELEDGSVSASLHFSEPPETLSIQTKIGRLQMKGPTQPHQKSSRIDTRVVGDQWEVKISSGEATLIPSAKDSQPIQLNERQKVEVNPTGATAVETFVPEVKLVSPPHNASLTIDPNQTDPIVFEWEPLDPPVAYRWVLAGDEKMTNILLEQNTDLPKTSVTYLDLGAAYWQVTAVSGDETLAISPIFKLHVEKHIH